MLTELGLTPAHLRAAPGPSSPYLDGVLPSTIFDLDSTQAESYSGAGVVWFNLVRHCADGSAPSAYNMLRGNGSTPTNLPSFIGTAGTQDAYWLMDGNDYFMAQSGVHTAFTQSLHISGTSNWWFAIAMRTAADDSNTSGLITTQNGATQPGIRIVHTASEVLSLVQRGDSTTNTLNTTAVMAGGTDYVILVSRNQADSKTAFYLNSTTPDIYNQTFTPATTPATNCLMFGVLAASMTGYIDNGARIYTMAMGNSYLTASDAGKILTHLRTRHGRAYA